MKKVIKAIVIALLVISVMLNIAVAVSGEDAGKVIYKNDFSSNQLDDTMWYSGAGTQIITDEFGERFLRCSDTNSRLNFGPEEAKNVDISFRMRARDQITSNAAYFGVYFRSFAIPANCLFAYQLRLNATKVSLVHMNNHYDTPTTVITEDATVKIKKAGLWYNVKISLRENRIVVFINGIKLIDVEDDKNPAVGGFGVMGTRFMFDIDDIVITGYSGKSLPEPTPNNAPAWVGLEGTDEEEEFADTGEERMNLFGGLSEKISTQVSAIAPGSMTLGKWIALGLLFIILLLISSIVVIFVLFKKRKDDNYISTPNINLENTEEVENNEEIT